MKVSDLFEDAGQGYDTGSGKFAPDVLSIDKFIELAESHSAQYLKKIGVSPIYRGASYNDAVGVVDTNRFTRTSANTHNYYTLWIDNNEKWSQYPKRSKSLICSNDLSNTPSYGDSFIIIPEDSAKIGICPDSDLWYSFAAELEYTAGVGWGRGLDIFMLKINDAFTAFKYGEPSTFDSLEYALSNIDIEAMEDIVWSFDEGNLPDLRWQIDSVKSLLSTMKKKKVDTLFDAFKLIFDPSTNDFSVTTAAKYHLPAATGVNGREVWVQGKCLVLSMDYAHAVNSGNKEDADALKLKAFIDKYQIKTAE